MSDESSVVRIARRAIAEEARRRWEQRLAPPRVSSSVCAIITVEDDLAYLSRTLAAVLAQDVLPAHFLLLHAAHRFNGSRHFVIPLTFVGDGIHADVWEEPRQTSFGTQISYALAHKRVPPSASLLWLLHDDSRPASPGVLHALVEAYRKAPNVSMVGAKQLNWHGQGLQNVGWLLDRHGRRASLVIDGEEDQSQYDNRQDVLGVSLAGALISRKTWRQIGGTDPWMGTYSESTDLCRRIWKSGHRVMVLPQAAVRHVRARYSGWRSADGTARRGQPCSTTMERLAAQEKIAITNTHAFALLPAFLWSIFRALGLFVAGLFRKQPRAAFAMLAIPWLRLAYLPRRLSPSRSYRRTGISARRYPSLVASRAQMRDWRVRARSFAAQSEGEPLNPLAEAHLHHLAILRAVDCAVLFLVGVVAMFAVSWRFLPSLLTGGSLVSSLLAPTAATAAQTFEAGTLMWTQAVGTGMVGAPPPFDLVLFLFALIGGGWLASGITIFWFLALPCAMLALYAVAGTVTRSRALRIVSALVWGCMAFLLGVVQTASLPLLSVFCLLPLSFYFVFRAVGWYAVDEPRMPHASVQAAALAGLFLALVCASEPQLVGPLLLSFLLYLFAVKEHRAMLLLMPVPAIVTLAPTFYYILLHAREGAWRQLFADSLIPGFISSSPSTLVTRSLGLDGSLSRFGKPVTIALAIVASILLIAALFSLFVRSARRMSRIAWVLVAAGAGLLALAPRIGIAPPSSAGSGPPTASCIPGLLMVVLGLLLAVCAVTGMNNSLFRIIPLGSGNSMEPQDSRMARIQTISSRKTPLSSLRGVLCAILLAGVALVAVLSGFAWPSSASVRATSQAVPIVAASDLADQRSAILAIQADSSTTLRYWVMRTGSGDLIDVSPMASVWRMNHTDPQEERIADSAAQLLSGGGEAANSLVRLGFIGVFVPPLGSSASQKAQNARDALVSHLLASDGTVQVTNTPMDGLYVRLQNANTLCGDASGTENTKECATRQVAFRKRAAARKDPQRLIWLGVLALVLFVYLVVAVPRSRHLSAEGSL